MTDYFQMKDPYTGNLLGIILIAALFLGRVVKFREKRMEWRLISWILYVQFLYCLLEPAAHAAEGIPGRAVYVFLLIANTLLFVCNIVLEVLWLKLIALHLDYRPGKGTLAFIFGILGAGLLLLAVNLFVPLVFRIEGNRYCRGDLYPVYLLIAAVQLAESLSFYLFCRRKGGTLKFFPVWAYLVPSLVGMAMETVTGSSFLGFCNAVSVTLTVSSLRDETMYRDSLTGLYNREYLAQVRVRLERARNPYVSGIMLDLNGFKQINDSFGHTEGDKALIQAAGIIRSGTGSIGETIRYAGDEFIVVLNTRKKEEILACMERIRENFRAYNARNRKPYRLSASMGYAEYDAEKQTMNEFLNTIDRNMYLDKERWYASGEAPGCRAAGEAAHA